MLATTHSLFGLFLTLILLAVFGVQQSLHWSILICGVFGALAPDLDHPKSTIGKLFFFISKPLEKRFGHRMATHSLIGWAVATVFFALIVGVVWIGYRLMGGYGMMAMVRGNHEGLPLRWIAAFSIGYVSHVILDMFNLRGVPMFWPNTTRAVIPGNPKYRMETGGRFEWVVMIVMALLLICALPISKYGIFSSMRWLLATPEAAIKEFKESKTKTYAVFDGLWSDSKQPVSGAAEILDVKNKRLIIRFENTIRTLSDEVASDISAKKVRIKHTDEPITLQHKHFENKNREYLLSKIPGDALVSGVIRLPKDLKLTLPESPFKWIEQVGDELRLTFAAKSQLDALAWDESFELMRKQDQVHLNKLKREAVRIRFDIAHVFDVKGLTAEGAALYLGQDEKDLRAQQKIDLQGQLEETVFAIEALQFKMKKSVFTFSGDVTIRR